MKYKTTAKAIRESYGKKIAISYCGAQHLLWNHSPVAYTCGVYGWNFDVYEINGITICTGYRGMVGNTVDYDLLKEYETRAEKIQYARDIDYDEKRELVENLLTEFLKKAV